MYICQAKQVTRMCNYGALEDLHSKQQHTVIQMLSQGLRRHLFMSAQNKLHTSLLAKSPPNLKKRYS